MQRNKREALKRKADKEAERLQERETQHAEQNPPLSEELRSRDPVSANLEPNWGRDIAGACT